LEHCSCFVFYRFEFVSSFVLRIFCSWRLSKLPQIGGGLGKAIRDFKKGVSGDELEDLSKELKKEDSKSLPR
jgi:hypothetical protein